MNNQKKKYFYKLIFLHFYYTFTHELQNYKQKYLTETQTFENDLRSVPGTSYFSNL